MNEDQSLDEHQDIHDAVDLDAESNDEKRIADLQRELEEARQNVLYAQAETQNVRRRLEQDKQSAANYAATSFARDMLSVKDNLDRALAAVPEELRADERIKSLLTGIEATGREVDNVFKRNGITRIEALGQPLDPNRHQAMMELPSADAEPGTIVQEMQAGYMIKDRLLRPALVGVAKSA
ncbi:MAG TPA: nucleotide exchange factor GrpE [Allosphingosinicella sp.]|jgi:molecular chaperone GrpE|uniref:nucleotide exchange factor GrpE n=1 Tax=Allosphingosinicella sp. TaxID=2823234 RepID=UPI002F28FA57